MSTRPITVVIPALNAADTIGRQIDALATQQDAPPFRIILVDNGSTDDTATVAARHADGRIQMDVVVEHRRGINNARNAGISVAPDGVILLCDADDVVAPTWVGRLAAAVDEGHWGAGALDYLTLNSPETVRIWGAPPLGVPTESTPYIDRTFGCCCGFLRSMWQAIDGFDPHLSGPTDENEFFMRAHATGFRPRIVPDAVIAYRLRPGIEGWRRMRFVSGRCQGIAASCAGAAHLRPLCAPLPGTLLLLKVLLSAPKYAWSASSRHQWFGGVLRQWGRLVGWMSPTGRAIRAAARQR
ncbi:MAG: glycosyltransferase family A protein [Ilumatobacteraceae bacterium]